MKHPAAKGPYNLLFQQNDSYRVQPQSRFNSNTNRTIVKAKETWDSGISCHVFAIQSPYTWDQAKQVNKDYEEVIPLNHFIEPKNYPWSRTQTLDSIQNYVQQNNEVALLIDNLQLCGGNHNPGDLQPEHMWLEDHTHNRAYDTFIDRCGVAVVDGVGGLNQDFRPGCEGSAFHHNQIERRQIAGYTWGHLLALASGVENTVANPIPDAIENSPEMVIVRKIIDDIQAGYDTYMDNVTTQDQRDAFAVYRNEIAAIQPREVIGNAKVDVDSAAQMVDQDINDVFNNLTIDQQTYVNEYKAACDQAEAHMRPIAIQHAANLINRFKVAKERIGATLVAVHEEEGARDLMKTLLEKKRDDILKEPDPATALDAFNKSMSDGNIAVLVQGIKDSLKAQKNAEFAADATKQREELMASYANNDGKLEELSQTLATNERIVATLAALPEEGGAQDFLKKLLEEKRDDILKKPNPMVALDAFNKSMSDGTIKILAQGMKDGLKAHKNPVFETQAIKQMKELMISYVDNDGKLAELSLTLPTNERIAATLAALPEGSARDLMKTLLEKKRDDILIGPDPVVALDAFNKSMSDENIVVLAQGIKDCLEVHDNPIFKEDAELQAHLDTQMKKLMDSYTKNDGKLAELSLSLSTEKNQLTAPCSYTAVLAVTSRIQEMKKINENVTNYAQNLVSIMKALPIEQRINFPHSKEPATFNAIQVFLTTNKDKPSDKVDETTPEVGQQVIDMLSNINGFLNDAQQEEQLVQKI